MRQGDHHTNLLVGLASVAVVGLTLTACAPAEDAMTPDEVRDALITTVTDTAALIDGPEWVKDLSTGPSECRADGTPGSNYAYAYGASRPDRDRLADVEKVAEYWESLGMTVKIVAERPAVYGSGGPIASISFSTDPGDYVIGGTSLCGTGEPGSETDGPTDETG